MLPSRYDGAIALQQLHGKIQYTSMHVMIWPYITTKMSHRFIHVLYTRLTQISNSHLKILPNSTKTKFHFFTVKYPKSSWTNISNLSSNSNFH